MLHVAASIHLWLILWSAVLWHLLTFEKVSFYITYSGLCSTCGKVGVLWCSHSTVLNMSPVLYFTFAKKLLLLQVIAARRFSSCISPYTSSQLCCAGFWLWRFFAHSYYPVCSNAGSFCSYLFHGKKATNVSFLSHNKITVLLPLMLFALNSAS